MIALTRADLYTLLRADMLRHNFNAVSNGDFVYDAFKTYMTSSFMRNSERYGWKIKESDKGTYETSPTNDTKKYIACLED